MENVKRKFKHCQIIMDCMGESAGSSFAFQIDTNAQLLCRGGPLHTVGVIRI